MTDCLHANTSAERACRSPARTLPPGERGEGVPAPLLAEAARAAQVRDALQAERQENAALLSACAEKTEEAHQSQLSAGLCQCVQYDVQLYRHHNQH